MKVKPYVVKQGDYLSKLALSMAFDADAVWNHPKNAGLKQKRTNREILAPGDVLHVPDEPRVPMPLTVGASNAFKGDMPKMDLVMAFKDSDGKPRATKKYWVHGLGDVTEQTTDGDGVAKLKVPVNVTLVKVVFEDDKTVYNVRVGHLDPVEEPSGVRSRLMHLGFFVEIPGATDEKARLSDGVKRFQKVNGLPANGTLDHATRKKLVEIHGC